MQVFFALGLWLVVSGYRSRSFRGNFGNGMDWRFWDKKGGGEVCCIGVWVDI